MGKGARTVIQASLQRISQLVLAGLLALALGMPAPAFAWGEYGHRTTATIAKQNLSLEARAEVTRLLRYARLLGAPQCPLTSIEDASVWPDCVREDRFLWGYTSAWHYRTAPICEDYNVRRNCSGGSCVTGQIERNHHILADEAQPDHLRLEALAFLVHFVGDVHQPLHSGDKGDRGANERDVDYGIKPIGNLHSVWDDALTERAISSAQPSLARRYSPAESAVLGGGDAAEWGRESWQLAREFVYPNAFKMDPCSGELPEKTALSEADVEAALPVVRRRIQQAGVRLAHLIEQAFVPGPLPREERP